MPTAAAPAPRVRRPTALHRGIIFARSLEPVLAALRAGGMVGNAEFAQALNACGIASEVGGSWSPQRVGAFRRRLEILNGQPPALHFRPRKRRGKRHSKRKH